MRIGIYNESTGGTLGGSEYLAAVLAASLSRDHDVELIHHHDSLDAGALRKFTGLPVEGVGLRYLPKVLPEPSGTRLPWKIWRESRSWQSDISSRYDTFVSIVHSLPAFCHAHQGVLLVLFPLFHRNAKWPMNDPPRGMLDLGRHLRNGYYAWEWRQRFRSYQRVISISAFTQKWTQEYWGVSSEVVYPPVAVPSLERRVKARQILSVGRFSSGGHKKRHPELIAALGALTTLRESGWSYHCVGNVGNQPSDQSYFRDVTAVAALNGAVLHPNASRSELNDLYASASIFVHGAGFLEPPDKPELTEHFGISTVEAMAAGCVPVVINKGAQPEIVRHGETGFVWNTLEELQHYVTLLASDDALRMRLASAAAERAVTFGVARFSAEMRRVLALAGAGAGSS